MSESQSSVEMSFDWKKIDQIFRDREDLYKERFTGITLQEQDVKNLKDIDLELAEETNGLVFSYSGNLQDPQVLRSETTRKISEIEYLNSLILHFDSFTAEDIRKFTENDINAFKTLETWRKLYCTYVPTNFYHLDSSFDSKKENFIKSTNTKKMISYNKITTTNRKDSLETLKKIIFVEYEKFQKSMKDENPKIILNIWDYKDLKDDLKEIKEHVEIEYGMFPGEFRVEFKSKTQFFIESIGEGKFKLNLEKLKEFHKFSESFSPREFCAPKSFYSEFRNLRVNTSVFIWYKVKKIFHSLLVTMKEWGSVVTLIMAVVVFCKK